MNKNNQIGRSMVEMLGVLAIIGVLSVGGIAGYSKAMEKFKNQKAFEQLQTILSNLTQLQLDRKAWEEVDNVTAIRAGIIPTEMLNGKSTATATKIYNAFNLSVEMEPCGLIFHLPNISSCVYFATANWIGFEFMIGGRGDHYVNRTEIPLSPARAQQICKEQIVEDEGGGYIEIAACG